MYYTLDTQENSSDTLADHLKAKAAARRAAVSLLCKRGTKTPTLSKYLSAFSRHNYGHINSEGKRTYRYTTGGVLWRRRERKPYKSLSCADLTNHVNRLLTFWYYSNSDPKQEYALLMLDFDAKPGKAGSKQGCIDAVKYISDKYFGGKLSTEDSTSGTGIHAYIWVYKLGCTAQDLNRVADKLQDIFRKELERVGADISGFDIQGTASFSTYEDGQLVKFVNGRLAKVPFNLDDRWPEFSLAHLDCIEAKEVPPPVTVRVWKPEEKRAVYGGTLTPYKDNYGHYRKLWNRLCAKYNKGEPVRAKNRYVVRADHGAVVLAILHSHSERPTRDGHLSQKTAKYLWTLAYDRREISVPWNTRRWIAARDFLSVQCNYIEWTSNSFVPPKTYSSGQVQKGKACRFTVTLEFSLVLSVQGGESSVTALPKGTGQPLKPVQKRVTDLPAARWIAAEEEISRSWAA